MRGRRHLDSRHFLYHADVTVGLIDAMRSGFYQLRSGTGSRRQEPLQ